MTTVTRTYTKRFILHLYLSLIARAAQVEHKKIPNLWCPIAKKGKKSEKHVNTKQLSSPDLWGPLYKKFGDFYTCIVLLLPDLGEIPRIFSSFLCVHVLRIRDGRIVWVKYKKYSYLHSTHFLNMISLRFHYRYDVPMLKFQLVISYFLKSC